MTQVQRGRDHGVGTYAEVKAFCMNHRIFRDFYPNGGPRMQNGWNNVVRKFNREDEIDLYAGLLMEQHMSGAQVGPTAGCIIAEQFIALKKGDKFWLENRGLFTDNQLAEVKSLSLAKLMCNTLEGTKKGT